MVEEYLPYAKILLISVSTLFGSIVFHELGHIIAYKAFKVKLVKIGFDKIPGRLEYGFYVSYQKDAQFSNRKDKIATFSGPLLEFIFGIIFLAYCLSVQNSYALLSIMPISSALYNLSPFCPDGSLIWKKD
ncbi:MAG: site-2 protease family protein [Patescibacteria group bacterium]